MSRLYDEREAIALDDFSSNDNVSFWLCVGRLSLSLSQVMIPGAKKVYRLMDSRGQPIADLITKSSEPAPEVGKRVLCRHPFQENKRANVV
jgi:hypothetical protein